jgi:hypothetical protein
VEHHFAVQSEEAGARRVTGRLSLEFADVVLDVESADAASLAWLAEFLDPWWEPSRRAADWRVRIEVSASRYHAMVEGRSNRAAPRGCFLFDQQVFTLPAWDAEGHTIVEDAERSLYFMVKEGEVEVVADPATKRWRFPLVWILTEVAAARLRKRCLDLHAAAVDGHGGVIVVAGPKLSGKTTLALHLLAHGAAWIGNDRVLVDGIGSTPRVRGVPSAVKIRPETAARFPELCGGGIAGVHRPYLLSEAELATAERAATDDDLAFTPAQVATRLGIERVAEAPLGAFVFPQVTPDVQRWDAQRLSADEVVAALRDCVYGGRRTPGTSTLFEAVAGGAHAPTAEQVDTVAHAAPGFRILLGPDAYDDAELAARLLDSGFTR